MLMLRMVGERWLGERSRLCGVPGSVSLEFGCLAGRDDSVPWLHAVPCVYSPSVESVAVLVFPSSFLQVLDLGLFTWEI